MPLIGKLYWSFISLSGPFIICTLLSLFSVLIANKNWLHIKYNFSPNYKRTREELVKCECCGRTLSNIIIKKE